MAKEDRHSMSPRARAVRMVSEVRERTGSAAAVAAVADRLGLDPRLLSAWVARAEAGDPVEAHGDQVAVLTRRINALQRENDILKAASRFFVRERDPRLRR